MLLKLLHELAVELAEELLLLLPGLVPVGRKLGLLLHLEQLFVVVDVNLVLDLGLFAVLNLDLFGEGLVLATVALARNCLRRSFLLLALLEVDYLMEREEELLLDIQVQIAEIRSEKSFDFSVALLVELLHVVSVGLSEPAQDQVRKGLLVLEVDEVQERLSETEELSEALRPEFLHQLLQVVEVVQGDQSSEEVEEDVLDQKGLDSQQSLLVLLDQGVDPLEKLSEEQRELVLSGSVDLVGELDEDQHQALEELVLLLRVETVKELEDLLYVALLLFVSVGEPEVVEKAVGDFVELAFLCLVDRLSQLAHPFAPYIGVHGDQVEDRVVEALFHTVYIFIFN